jgi:hypothetical protein
VAGGDPRGSEECVLELFVPGAGREFAAEGGPGTPREGAMPPSPMVRSMVAAVLMPTPGWTSRPPERGQSSRSFSFFGHDGPSVSEFVDFSCDAGDDQLQGLCPGHGPALLA